MSDHSRGVDAFAVAAATVIFAGLLVGPLLSALLVLAWVRLSRTPWRDIGYVRPRNWFGSLAFGVVFGAAFKLLLKAVVLPLLGADPINRAYHYLAGNPAAIPGALFMFIVSAGFGEETFFRGYLFERSGKLFGHSPAAKIATVLLTAALFGLAHYPSQGLWGAVQATIVGLVFGAIFAVTGSLWMLMCAHVAFDLMAYVIIYWDLEWKVSHIIFK